MDSKQGIMFENPNYMFGMANMISMEDMMTILKDLLRLYNMYIVDGTNSEHPNIPTNYCDLEYFLHRQFAIRWLTDILNEDLSSESSSEKPSIIMPAVKLMDRYVTACEMLGENQSQILHNIGNIRAACFSLAYKMFSVSKLCALKDIVRVNDLSYTLSLNTNFEVSDTKGIEKEEIKISSILKGNLFPVQDCDLIFVLSYLLLHLVVTHTHKRFSITYILNQKVALEALRCFQFTLVSMSFLRFNTWKCITVCCLCAVVKVCSLNLKTTTTLQEALLSVLQQLQPGPFTMEELLEIYKHM